MIEIKPEIQTKPPKPLEAGKKPTKSYINQVTTYLINEAKWTAAEAYCERKGYQFLIMDEYSLGIKTRK